MTQYFADPNAWIVSRIAESGTTRKIDQPGALGHVSRVFAAYTWKKHLQHYLLGATPQVGSAQVLDTSSSV